MKHKRRFAMPALALIALISLGGIWFAWNQGLIGDKPILLLTSDGPKYNGKPHDAAAIKELLRKTADSGENGVPEACLPLPNLLGEFNYLGPLRQDIEFRYRDTYVAPLLVFERILSFDEVREGRLRFAVRLARHGILVGEPVTVPTPRLGAGTYGQVIGGMLYRVAPTLEKFLMHRKAPRSAQGPQYCLRFADSEFDILRVEGMPAWPEPGKKGDQINNAYYDITGRVRPTRVYPWMQALIDAGDLPEVNAVASGLLFTGRINNVKGQLSIGPLFAAYPESSESIAKVGPMRETMSKIEIEIGNVRQWIGHEDIRAILADPNNPAILNALVIKIRDNPQMVSALSKQCDERKSRLDSLRPSLAMLRASDDYPFYAAYMSKHLDATAADLQRTCQELISRIRDVQKSHARIQSSGVTPQDLIHGTR